MTSDHRFSVVDSYLILMRYLDCLEHLKVMVDRMCGDRYFDREVSAADWFHKMVGYDQR